MKRALIVGSGVGGLTAAVALARTGWDVEVLERSPDARQILVGGGLHIWPNGMRELGRLGLGEAVTAVGETIGRLDWHSPEQGLLASADLAATARRVHAPSLGIRRADLLAVLLEAVGDDRIHFGAGVLAAEAEGQGVTATLADGTEARADLLVAADGAQSTVRTRVAGETLVRAPGVIVCQAIVEGFDAPAGVFAETWAERMRLGCYPVRDGLFWFAFLRADDVGAGAPTAAHELLLEHTRSWRAPGRDAIEATPAEAVGCSEVFAREPVVSWTDGRIVLLGDAAHAMTPFTGQGACQAIEDALVLAECLRVEGDVSAALRRYAAIRAPRTSEIWSRSWTAATSLARKRRAIDPARRRAFADTFERVVWKQLEQLIVQPLEPFEHLGSAGTPW